MNETMYVDRIHTPPGVRPATFYPIRRLRDNRILGWFESANDAPRMKAMDRKELSELYDAAQLEPLTEQLDLFDGGEA
jgi:hypothetical protein